MVLGTIWFCFHFSICVAAVTILSIVMLHREGKRLTNEEQKKGKGEKE